MPRKPPVTPRKTAVRPPATRRAPVKKAAALRAAVKKTATPRKTVAKKAPAKRTVAPRKAPAKKATALRVVRPGEKAPPPPPKAPLTITEAAEANDERALLVALRKNLAQSIQESSTPPRDKASLSIRLLQINRDIQAFDARAKEERSDADSVADAAFDPEAL